ncbi:MAG: SRPBCC family protein [Acidimicrobiales bacterium]
MWHALTDPALLSDWLDGEVTLDVRPGGDGVVVEPDGAVRRAVVEDVEPLRRLALRGWPEDGAGPESTVELELAPAADGVGTRLVVTETVVAPASAPPASASARASAAALDFRWAVRLLLLGCCLVRVAVARR